MKLNSPRISIIIPVLNEENTIADLLLYLKAQSSPSQIAEIIVVDGGSSDSTISVASQYQVTILNSEKGRAKQMNLGAQHASSELLYFLHVDTFPPDGFDTSIIKAFQSGSLAGCFQMKFDSNHWFLNFFAWFSKINHKLCRGGDQSLFISKNLFNQSGGFNEKYMIYEDNEFTARLYNLTDFVIIPQYVKTSARKYEQHGVLALQYHFGIIHLKRFFGAGPDHLYAYYKRKITI